MRNRPAPKPDHRQLNVLVPDAVFVALADHATRRRETRAAVVLEALEQYLARETRRAVTHQAAAS